MNLYKKRIIIVSPGGSFFIEPFVRAFNKLGFECVVFDHRQGLVYTSRFVRKIFHKFPYIKVLKHLKIKQTNHKLLELVNGFKPEYVFAQKAENIEPETLLAIKKLGVKTINFYNDFINQWQGIRKIAPYYDCFFSPDHHVLRKLWSEGLKNCFYMPFAIDLMSSPVPFDNRREIYPVTFLGTYNPALYHNREPYLDKIKDLGLNIWGNDRWLKSSLAKYYRGPAHGLERFDIYGKSKIVIDINWNEWPCEAMSMRPFEVGCSGALYIGDNIRADLFRVFKEGKEFISFKDGNELREKVGYFLSREGERLLISRALHEDIMVNHTYDKRVEQIFDQLKKLPK